MLLTLTSHHYAVDAKLSSMLISHCYAVKANQSSLSFHSYVVNVNQFLPCFHRYAVNISESLLPSHCCAVNASQTLLFFERASNCHVVLSMLCYFLLYCRCISITLFTTMLTHRGSYHPLSQTLEKLMILTMV